jgi:hypothetical protein
MQQLLAPETFEFFARYLLAGFVIYAVRGFYVLGDRPKQSEIIFEAIVLSLINQFVWLFVEPGLRLWNLVPGLPPFWLLTENSHALFFAEILVQPAVLGLVLGLNLHRGWNAAILRRLSMPVVQPTRRACDHVFGQLRQASFVIMTYEDGTRVYDYLGEGSFIGSDAMSGDVFIERLYDVLDGQWRETRPPRSAWLSMAGVRSIEFLTLDEGGPSS